MSIIQYKSHVIEVCFRIKYLTNIFSDNNSRIELRSWED